MIVLVLSSSRALIISVAVSSLPLAFQHLIYLITFYISNFVIVHPVWLLVSGGLLISLHGIMH